MTDKPVREQILENTLGAVRQKKSQRKKNQTTLMWASALAAVSVMVISSLKDSSPHERPSEITVIHSNENPNPDPLPTNKVRVDISEDGTIQTKSISLEELARIVYNPSLKFSRTNDTFTWKGDSKIIYMSLPQTSMAITDTRDEAL